jgi:RNA polymerase sigma-70 factor (ECF subfamily)
MQIDLDILKKCANNDRMAQKKLYELCFRMLMPLCFSFSKNEEDARHLLNLGFLKICQNLNKVELENIAFTAWSKKIMRNVIIDEYRSNKKYIENIDMKETDRELEYYQHANSNTAEVDLDMEDIKRLIEQLPETTKRVVLLFSLEGYGHKEIGAILKISEGTSKWHLSNGRKLLKELLSKNYKEDYFMNGFAI